MYLLVLLMVFILGMVGVLLFRRDSHDPSERRPSGGATSGMKTLGPGAPGEAAAAAGPPEGSLRLDSAPAPDETSAAAHFIVQNLLPGGAVCVFDAEGRARDPLPLPADSALGPWTVPTTVYAGWRYAPAISGDACGSVNFADCELWTGADLFARCLTIPAHRLSTP